MFAIEIFTKCMALIGFWYVILWHYMEFHLLVCCVGVRNVECVLGNFIFIRIVYNVLVRMRMSVISHGSLQQMCEHREARKKKLYWNRRNFVCMWCTMFDGIMRLMLMNAYNMKWKSNSDQKLGVNTHTHTQHPCSHTHSYTYVLHALWTE